MPDARCRIPKAGWPPRSVGPRCDAAGQPLVGRDYVEPGTFAVRGRVVGAGAVAPDLRHL
jgi:hypothetical protein